MVSASRQMTVYCFRQPRLPLQLPGCPSPPPTKASVLYGIGSSLLSKTENYRFWNVGKHGLIIEFIDPDYNVMRSATCLPEVAADEESNARETQSFKEVGQRQAIDSLMRKAATMDSSPSHFVSESG